MRLCPQITRDLATPFISKDGRYVDRPRRQQARRAGVAQDLRDHRRPIPAAQTTTCAERVDFGFAAGKADFSFDGRSCRSTSASTTT